MDNNNCTDSGTDFNTTNIIVTSVSSVASAVLGFLASLLIYKREQIKQWMKNRGKDEAAPNVQTNTTEDKEPNSDIIVSIPNSPNQDDYRIKIRSRHNSDKKRSPSVKIEISTDESSSTAREKEDKKSRPRAKSLDESLSKSSKNN